MSLLFPKHTTKWKLLLPGCLLLIAIGGLSYSYRYRLKNKVARMIPSVGFSYAVSGTCYNCSSLFTDRVSVHQRAYRGEGIPVQRNKAGLTKLHSKGVLVELATTDLYTVSKLDFSQPLILPKGRAFTNELGRRYAKRCLSDNLEYLPFTISSITRSQESVKGLIAVNENAIQNSAHLRGKTFDINYRAFGDNPKQIKLFIKTLYQLKVEGRCFVRFERNGCLHVTAI